MLNANHVNAMQTHVPFKLADMSGLINDKMVSTYRGGDNMKLKIIEQSVLPHSSIKKQPKGVPAYSNTDSK